MPEALPTVPGAPVTPGSSGLSSEHRDALRLFGYLLLRQQCYPDAVAVFRGLLATDPSDRHARRSLIYAYLASNEAEHALELAGTYAPQAGDPATATIHLLRAQALWRLGRPQEARQHLERFIEMRRAG